MGGWPEDWDERRRGAGCPMCAEAAANSDEDESPHGIRILRGRWSDAMLGRYAVRPGYAIVKWKGRHVAEPTELTPEEAQGFWGEVASVSWALEARYAPAKMNWLHLGNGVPHLHVHLVPRPYDDASAGVPVEAGAWDQSLVRRVPDDVLRAEARVLREALSEQTVGQ